MRPLERRLKDIHSVYVENFGEHVFHLPSVDRWHTFAKNSVLDPTTFTYHEARVIRLIHALLERASSGEIITSPYEYVRIYAKAKFNKSPQTTEIGV